MRSVYSILIFLIALLKLHAQERVSFLSSDQLEITADLYLKDPNLPFIILCHQENSSRGEFREISGRLLKLDFNCLALDLRSGESMNFINNLTAEKARSQNLPHSLLDSRKDIEAAIQYIKKFNVHSVILFGSSYSASLCLLIAMNSAEVRSVIAFSPGEYFRPELVVKDAIAGLNIPVFVSVTNLEFEYVSDMLSAIPENLKTIYKPAKSQGVHGAKALWQASETSNECWLELLLFFKKIKE
jgi:dienelactone hydrolase